METKSELLIKSLTIDSGRTVFSTTETLKLQKDIILRRYR